MLTNSETGDIIVKLSRETSAKFQKRKKNLKKCLTNTKQRDIMSMFASEGEQTVKNNLKRNFKNI